MDPLLELVVLLASVGVVTAKIAGGGAQSRKSDPDITEISSGGLSPLAETRLQCVVLLMAGRLRHGTTRPARNTPRRTACHSGGSQRGMAIEAMDIEGRDIALAVLIGISNGA